MIEPRWTHWATAPVPRYTSYPTAAEFEDGFPRAALERWAGALDGDAPISVYVHIPFCEKLCWYCGCHTSVPNGYDRVARYLTRLHHEIDLWAQRLAPHGGARHVHFGGGSPNMLAADDFFALMEHLREAFAVHEESEIAVELDPRSLTREKIAAMAASGVTRASLGVQTLSPKVQEAINRVQPRDMIEKALGDLRAAGIDAINFDLMYGLPHQGEADIIEAAGFTADLRVDRVAVFGYAHVPWFAKHQAAIDASALPGLQARFAQADACAAALEARGYARIGLDHFAKPVDPLARAAADGTLRRNFQGYTTDPCETIIGIGNSAISTFREGFAQAAKDMREWTDAVEAGGLPVARGRAISDDDRLRARAIEALMCNLEVDLEQVCAEMGAPAHALDEALIRARPMAEAGLCEISGRAITVPEAARMLVRPVAAAFDAYRDTPQEGRHARAV